MFVIFVFTLVVLLVVAFIAGFSTYVERRVSAFMQNRIGPNRVGPYGLLQFVADGVKLLFKEDVINEKTDKLLFIVAPYIVFVSTFLIYAVIPYGVSLSISDLNIGLIYILAVSSFTVIGILMAGLSSGSKWSLYGGMRSAAQMVSYEIPMGIVFLVLILMVGSMNLNDLLSLQAGALHHWLVFKYPPITIILFLIYFICILAETNRLPFDIPEAESELTAGYHTEYSGMRFAMFFLGEYASILALCSVATVIFLGGAYPPWGSFLFHGLLGKIESVLWLLIKAYSLVFVVMWLRWTLPRYRVDQLMGVCWKVLVPISFLCLFIIGIVVLYSK